MAGYIRKRPALTIKSDVININWNAIVLEVLRRGYSSEAVARFCGCDKGHIQRLRDNLISDTKWVVGMRLIELKERTS